VTQAKDLSWLRFLAEVNYDHAMAKNHLQPFPFKVIEAKYLKAEKKGWLDYGVSLTTGWLTPEGKKELQRLWEQQ